MDEQIMKFKFLGYAF